MECPVGAQSLDCHLVRSVALLVNFVQQRCRFELWVGGHDPAMDPLQLVIYAEKVLGALHKGLHRIILFGYL